MGDTQHSLRILRRSGRLPWRVPLRFPARAGGRLRPAAVAAATLMIVAVLSLTSLFSSPAFALPAKAKAKLKIPHVPLAQVPWQRHFSHPTPIFVPLMSLPWADCHVRALQIPNAGIDNRHKGSDPDGHFIMAMCQDRQGNLWLATEGAGVYRYDPSAAKGQRWTQFTKQSTHGGLENNCIYAIACDNQDRIWVGELNHGISVFNGRRWQDYDIVQNPQHHVLAGPLGNHVYAMKFDRYTDQMWICTENGISVYQCRDIAAGLPAVKSSYQNSTHHWHYITQASGLPMNPDSIAFASNGVVDVGTQCGGLAIGTPTQGRQSDNALGWSRYRWTVIKGPWHMPLTATGNGLPGNLVNSVTTMWANHLAVATDEGIALGSISGRVTANYPAAAMLNLEFQHGQNFVAKVHGLWHPPVHWQAPPGQVLETLPTEDHTTAVAWEPDKAAGGKAGYLWLGHWRTGLDVWQYDAEGAIINRWHIHRPQVGNYVQCLQPLKGGAMAVGCYGKGAEVITLPGQSKDAWRDAAEPKAQFAAAPEPHEARPPSERELNAMAAAIRKELLESKDKKQPRIVPLPDDWRTEGNWLGRYGKYWMCLFAGRESIGNLVWNSVPRHVRQLEFDGPHVQMVGGPRRLPDTSRYWVQQDFTGNPRALQLPPAYYPGNGQLLRGFGQAGKQRRISEIDDHGEAYPAWWQGPDVNVLLTIPRGLFTLSFYEWNYNGHTTANRLRDYAVSVQTFPNGWRYGHLWSRGRGVPAACYRQPSKVVARAEQNWGGEWVRFLVRGPVEVGVRFHRNYSFNTHVSGAALDWTAQRPPPYFCSVASWPKQQAEKLRAAQIGLAALRAGIYPLTTGASSPQVAACHDLLTIARLERRTEPTVWASHEAIIYSLADRCLQACGHGSASSLRLLAACNYRLCRFRQWEGDLEREGLPVPRKLEEMTKWKGRTRVFRDGGYRQLARDAARQRTAKLMAARQTKRSY